MAKTAVVVLAEGFEEIEALTPVDVLRRAGVTVHLAGIRDRSVTGSHGIRVQADLLLREIADIPDAVILPGGMPGAENLRKSGELGELLKKMDREKKTIAAICAAPALVLAGLGLLSGRRATCYPGCEADFKPDTHFLESSVVEDGHIITSRGPGTALDFALAIAKQLAGKEKCLQVANAMVASSGRGSD